MVTLMCPSNEKKNSEKDGHANVPFKCKKKIVKKMVSHKKEKKVWRVVDYNFTGD